MSNINRTPKPSLPHLKAPLKALCIHGHFYQPPREDPLTGLIPEEAGAAPYHNWNERIHAECYRPNAELGNFERISFNVGPTLLRWMEEYDPVTYRRILAQDHCNVQRYGLGNALAQAYNHTILPLASHRDKVTQIAWGLTDFEHRFGRKAQGMWLPETAVDLETLQILADHGVEFTILAPWQATADEVDPTEPYWVQLPNGGRMAVFFYHASLSGGVSFDQRLTDNAHNFALKKLGNHFREDKTRTGAPQILIVASDGELYGHHQSFRDWFLAYLVNGAGARAGLQLTYPARWLKEHPPQKEITLRERTSWSCFHGIARWSSGCDCTSGDWGWKSPLRQALDQLGAALDAAYEQFTRALGYDPWGLRNAYIHVILKKTGVRELLSAPSHRLMIQEQYSQDDMIRLETLLEAQRHRQEMFTSCGWFFGEFERIEPRNNLAHAAQAVRLTQQATGIDLSQQIVPALQNVIGASGQRGSQVFQQYNHE